MLKSIYLHTVYITLIIGDIKQAIVRPVRRVAFEFPGFAPAAPAVFESRLADQCLASVPRVALRISSGGANVRPFVTARI